MTKLVECPICHTKRTARNRYRYFRCCNILHTVKDNLLGIGVNPKRQTKKIIGKIKENFVEVEKEPEPEYVEVEE